MKRVLVRMSNGEICVAGKTGIPLLFENAATPTLMGYSIILLSSIELRRKFVRRG
jgi:hypothetical protein